MTTEVSRHFAATRSRVYEALITADDVARWRFPAGMSCRIEAFDGREGGRIRISLNYESVDAVGKTEGRPGTYRRTSAALIPDELVVEVDEFETVDPELAGEMTMT